MSAPELLPPVNMLMSALWWAGKHIPVLPLHHPVDGTCSCGRADCSSPAKHPVHELVPHGLTDATTNAEVIRRWWARRPYANIGIRTGDVVDLLDIDSTDGLAAFAAIVEQAGGMPHHLGVAQSGRDGFGQHLYVGPGGEKALTGGRTAPAGIDVKGRGGYAVAPPSLHISGRRYQWISNQFDSGALAGEVDWPSFYRHLVVRPIEPPRGPRPTTAIPVDAANAYGRAVLARAVSLIDAAQPGNRWQTLAVDAIPLVARGVDGGCIDRDSGVRELEEAARRAGLGHREIARVGPLVDDMIARGIRFPIRPREAARVTHPERADRGEHDSEEDARAEPWETPWPLRYPTPPFPVEVLGWMRGPVEELARQLQCPVDLIAMMTLATVAAVVRGRIRVWFTADWDEPLNVYIAVVLGSGETKSPALARITAELRQMEAEARAEARERIAAAQFDRDLLDERAKRLRDTAVKQAGRNRHEQLLAQNEARDAALEAEQIVVPPMPLWLAGDMTPEALVAKLAEQGGALAHLSAEGELLDTIVGGRYSSGAPHLSALLTAHDGREPVRVHRKREPDIEVASPCLTLGLAVQPQVLEAMGKVDAAVRRGLAARFLFAIPGSLVGRRDMTVSRSSAAVEAFGELVRAVDRLASGLTGCRDIGHSAGRGGRDAPGSGAGVFGDMGTDRAAQLSGAGSCRSEGCGDIGPEERFRRSEVSGITGHAPYRYGFIPSSSLLVIHYRETLEPRRAGQTGDLGEIGPWANKLDGQIVRLAGLLQLIRDADPAADRDPTSPTHGSSARNPRNLGEVGVEAAAGALVLADYLIAHAVEAHAVMGGAQHTDENTRARHLIGWIAERGLTEFTVHDAERSLRRRITFREPGAVHEACTTLARLGWLRYVPPPEGQPGRPSTRYLVHPDVHTGGAP